MEYITELILRFKNADPAVVLPIAVVVAATLVAYFLLRKKENKLSRDTDNEQPRDSESISPQSVEAEEFSSPDIPPNEVSESVPETQFIAPEPLVKEEKTEEKETVEPFFDPVPEVEPIEAVEEPLPVQETEAQPEEDMVAGEVVQLDEEPEKDFFSRLTLGLSKTRRGILQNLEHVFSSGQIDDETWDEFEEILIMSDMGVATTVKLREKVSSAVGGKEAGDIEKIKSLLEKEILEILKEVESPVAELSSKPTVFVVAGVNGVGKTTSIGKIASRFTNDGKKVMVAAADTFRAAAVEQLGVWAERIGSDFLRGQTGADPSAVAYDAVKASISRDIDLLIIDTAGRVHTKTGLMEELKKLRRVTAQGFEGAPHETLLVVDATTGQNAVEQARAFSEAIGVTGIVLTKLDGTAKGGIIVAIAEQLGLPVKYIGVGEGLGDLREFDAEQFVKALFASDKEVLH